MRKYALKSEIWAGKCTNSTAVAVLYLEFLGNLPSPELWLFFLEKSQKSRKIPCFRVRKKAQKSIRDVLNENEILPIFAKLLPLVPILSEEKPGKKQDEEKYDNRKKHQANRSIFVQKKYHQHEKTR